MSETRSDSRPLGTLRRSGDERGVVRLEDVYDTGIEDLWSALTEPERLARWLVEVDGDDLRVGGEVQARFTSTWTGPARIDVCQAPHRLVVTLDPGDEDETELEAILTPEGERTRLVIEERGLPVSALAGHGAGWQAHVDDLVAYLAGSETGSWRERWVALTPAYEEIAAALD
ncbi:MAG: SRPBCC family protein [Nocardioidaceae bacterium]|nr:SRPBCC family protein [Nocardioidaceae bacterium]